MPTQGWRWSKVWAVGLAGAAIQRQVAETKCIGIAVQIHPLSRPILKGKGRKDEKTLTAEKRQDNSSFPYHHPQTQGK